MIYHDMSFDEYRKLDALNNSSLKDFAKSPVIYKWNKEHQSEETKSFAFGTMVHKWVLERDTFDHEYFVASEDEKVALETLRTITENVEGVISKERIAVYPESLGKARRGAKYEKFLIENPEKIIILEKEEESFFNTLELNTIVGPRNVITEETYEKLNKQLGNLIVHGMNELTVVFEYKGITCKARFDNVYGDLNGVFGVTDVKTTKAPHKFEREISNLLYYMQVGFYCIAAREEFGRLPDKFNFLAIPNFEPYSDYTVHYMNREYVDYSISLVDMYIDEFITRKKNNDWSRRDIVNEVFKPAYL